ncbi:MAG: cytochrome c5 family protein [Pseudomonadales bacterium]
MRTPLILAFVLLVGCDAGPADSPPPAASSDTAVSADTAGDVAAAPSPEQMAQWTRNCALCHVRGEGGAPVLGDQAEWAVRAAKGEDVLLAHTLEGFNNMPPLGYCMDCEADDFRTLIRFMGGER